MASGHGGISICGTPENRFQSRPGLEPFGVETFVLEMVTVDPDTESTGATLVQSCRVQRSYVNVARGRWRKIPGPSSLFVLAIPKVPVDAPT